MGGFAEGLGEIGRGVGPYFGAAFLLIVFVWVQFVVRWRDERRALGLSDDGLARLVGALESRDGALRGALADRFRGRACAMFADRAAFDSWFAQQVDSRHAGELFRTYLWHALNTGRARLRADDNRVGLTAVRNRLKRYRYHRWLNLGLANVAVSLGILGTVTGLWAGFDRIDFGGGDVAAAMEDVMGALSRALHTTAVGVLLSIPIVISGLKMEQQLEEMFGMAREVHEALAATLREFENESPVDGA